MTNIGQVTSLIKIKTDSVICTRLFEQVCHLLVFSSRQQYNLAKPMDQIHVNLQQLLCWKIIADADSSIITALAELGQAAYPNEEIVAAIEKFVCLLYQLRTSLLTVKELRWSFFKKKTSTIRQVATNTGRIAPGNP